MTIDHPGMPDDDRYPACGDVDSRGDEFRCGQCEECAKEGFVSMIEDEGWRD